MSIVYFAQRNFFSDHKINNYTARLLIKYFKMYLENMAQIEI